jgi:hypothetical protein
LAVEIFNQITGRRPARQTSEKREDILVGMWTGGKFPPMTKGGSLLKIKRVQSATDTHFLLLHFEFSHDKVSDKN